MPVIYNKMPQQKNIQKIMRILEKEYKQERRTTLNSMRSKENKENAFKILISCLLSLRTRDENTEKVTKNLFAVAQTPEEIIKLPIKKLEKLIFSSGYYKNKARTLKHVSSVILERFKGKVPDNKEELLSIKGIGPKTANVVLCFAFDKNAIPVDVNVHRIANRLGWVKEKTPEKTEKALEKVLPEKYWKKINGLFILHGRAVCLPRKPKCSICVIEQYCGKIGILS